MTYMVLISLALEDADEAAMARVVAAHLRNLAGRLERSEGGLEPATTHFIYSDPLTEKRPIGKMTVERQAPKVERRVKAKTPKERQVQLDAWFVKLYGEWYPKKEKKALSYKAFIALDPDRETMGKISVDLQRRLGAPKSKGGWKDEEPQYIPALAVYLNQRRWEDRR